MPSLISALTAAAALVAAALAPATAADPTTQLRSAGDVLSTDSLQVLPEGMPEALTLAGGDDGEVKVRVGRGLLRSKRRRGSSKASRKTRKSSPKKKKKSSKKKSSSMKKKSSTKKKSSKKKSSKKKSSKKKSAPKKKTQFRQQASGVTAEVRFSSGGKKYSVTSKSHEGHGTHFAAMGKPYAGCGVPPHRAYDDNGNPLPWVALNTNAEFENGINCGRWIEIKLGQNCVGAGNAQWSVCNGGNWESDDRTGETMYGYVMDHCPDQNFWCQNDAYHLDISRPYLTGMGLTGPHIWNGRKVHWSYIDDVPGGWKMSNLKFMWLKSSNWIPKGYGFFGGLICYNMPNGISRMSQKIGNKWVPVRPLFHLRNQWILQKPSNYVSAPNGGQGQEIHIEAWDAQGNSYGKYAVEWGCGTGSCWDDTDAKSRKIG